LKIETPPNVTYFTPKAEITAAVTPYSTDHELDTYVSSNEACVESTLSTTDRAYGTGIPVLVLGRINELIRELARDYPILTTSANPHIDDLLSQVRGYNAEVSDQALADCAVELVDLAGSSVVDGRVSAALTAYVVAILLCSRCNDIDKQLLITYTTSFIVLQEQEILLPASLYYVIPSYQKLLALLETIYPEPEPDWYICMRMSATVARLFRSAELKEMKGVKLRSQFSQHELGFGERILGVINQTSHFLSQNYWARECDLQSLPFSSASDISNAGVLHEFIALTSGWVGDHHVSRNTFQKRSQDIMSRLGTWMVTQHNIQFSPTSNQHHLWAALLLESYELSKIFSSMKMTCLSQITLVYPILHFDMFIIPQGEPNLRWTIEFEEAMGLNRGALERLTRLQERMGNKVQRWLRGEIGALSIEENNAESPETYRRIPLMRSDDASTANSMDLNQDEMGVEDTPSQKESFSIMEVDENERDEGISVVTDLKSSRYGITYTESGMTGISFDYSAFFR
jgi:hypothetical protein